MLSESESFIEAVESTMIAMFHGATADPLMAAVAVAVRVAFVPPNIGKKSIGTVTCCATAMAFEFEGPKHCSPNLLVRVARHLNLG